MVPRRYGGLAGSPSSVPSSRCCLVATVQWVVRMPGCSVTCLVQWDGQPIVAAMNQWAFEGVTIDAETHQVRSHFLTPLEWHTPFSPRYPGRRPSLAYRPGASVSAVACTARGVLYWAQRNDWEAVPPEHMGAHIEFRDYDGALHLQRFIPTDDSLYFGVPVAGWGDHVVFRRNDADIPYLNIVQIESDQRSEE